MEETISKTYIIILALMYNYISNKSDALKKAKGRPIDIRI